MVVDDERELLSLASLILSWASYDVTTTTRPTHALDLLTRGHASRPVDVLVTDVWMPGMSGIELIRRSRSLGANPPTLVISAHDAEVELDGLLRPGVDAYLGKPFLADVFLEHVRALASALPGRTHRAGWE